MTKPRGYFKNFLVIDSETTGIAYGSPDPSYDAETKTEYQAISWGLIVADGETLEPLEDLYLELKWNGDAAWDRRAQEIHGLSPEYLEENGLDEIEAIEQILNLIIKYWGPDFKTIRTAGQNVATFDNWFLRRLMARHEFHLPLGNCHIDTSTLGFVNYKVYNSDDLFYQVGCDPRGEHNALDDAYMSLKAIQISRMLFQHVLHHQVT